MPQFLRPSSDIAFIGQTVPSSQPAYSVIDEAVADNSDRLELNHFGTPEYVHVALSGATDPQVHTAHYVRIEAARADNSQNVKLRLELRQGTSTLLDFTVLDLTTVLQTFEWELPTGTAASITSYAAGSSGPTLYAVPTLGSPLVVVSWVEMQVPTAGYEHLDIDGPGFKTVAANSGFYLVADGPGLRRVAGLEVPGSGALVLDGAGFRAT